MSAEEKVVVVFGMSTGGTVRTIPRIAAMDDSTDRKKLMSPLEKEVRTMVIDCKLLCRRTNQYHEWISRDERRGYIVSLVDRR